MARWVARVQGTEPKSPSGVTWLAEPLAAALVQWSGSTVEEATYFAEQSMRESLRLGVERGAVRRHALTNAQRQGGLEKLDERAARLALKTRQVLEAELETGLQWRRNRLLCPPIIFPGQGMADDWLAYKLLYRTTRNLGGRVVFDTRPCERCTLIFDASRANAVKCDLCSKGGRLAPPLGLHDGPLAAPGDQARVRVPRRAGRMLLGWGKTTVGYCSECGEFYHGPRSGPTCGAVACRQRRSRATRHTAE